VPFLGATLAEERALAPLAGERVLETGLDGWTKEVESQDIKDRGVSPDATGGGAGTYDGEATIILKGPDGEVINIQWSQHGLISLHRGLNTHRRHGRVHGKMCGCRHQKRSCFYRRSTFQRTATSKRPSQMRSTRHRQTEF
jgi:hypothetical protein